MLHPQLDAAFADAFALPGLVALFGAEATRNALSPFDRHFLDRLAWALDHLPAADNPFLWQVLAGRYPRAAAADWLDLPARPPRCTVACHASRMDALLAGNPACYDLIHLSNILDWLSADAAAALLAAATAALRPGGRLIIRQLNSSLDIPASAQALSWERERGDRLHATDRSFFYRRLLVARRSA